MASKSQRHARRLKRKNIAAQAPGPVDPHLLSVLKSMGGMGSKMLHLSKSEDRAAASAEQLAAAVDALAEEMEGHNRFQVCEGARQSCLPWTVAGVMRPDTDGGAAIAELLTLIAFAGGVSTGAGTGPLSPKLERWGKSVNDIIQIASIDHLIAATAEAPEDPMAKIVVAMRGSEVWIRSSSYPQMVEETLLQLFDTPNTKSALVQAVGFDAVSALTVMGTCHAIQMDGMNVRLERSFRSIDEAVGSGRLDGPDPTIVEETRRLWDEAWEPTENQVTVSVSAVADLADLPHEVVEAVIEQFALELDDWTPQQVVREFTSGNNPLRTNPILRSSDGRVMLVHDALVLPAVRENLEQVLKGTTVWDVYQKHRGNLLEERAGQYLATMMPGARVRAGFEYFVPASTDELAAGEPVGYTKLVEGDLLLVKDDVAVIVEAKAVALAPSARAGQTRRLRSDLTRIVTKAAEQASRLKVLIERDHGFRLRNNDWVDMSRVREIHTIAVSLDDLSGVATTTADLIQAGLLDPADIPWTVSLHDLQLISELVDAPAEFLLYLRRRRDPEATVVYSAPDELDLFLYFFEKGLYVAPDPELMKRDLSYITEARTGDVRRRRNQGRQYITSRTDPLDAWYYFSRGESEQPASKPALTGSPMHDFVKGLQKRGDYGWLSIGATLLSGSTKTQADWARTPARLLSNPRSDGRETTLTMPFGATREDAWLLVWATQPLSANPALLLERMGSYLRSKKYQLGLRRGCVFVFDEGSKELSHVLFDDTLPEPDPEMDEAIKSLIPVDKMPRLVPPKAKKRAKRK